MFDAIFDLLLAGLVAWLYYDVKKLKAKVGE